MTIQLLQITNLRNISTLQLQCNSQINVIHGQNGSGKTSILEALYLLSCGKSFRSHLKSRLIQHDMPSLTLFARIQLENGKTCPLGLEKSQSDETKLKFNHEMITSIAKFAQVLPVQLLHPHSYLLLEGGSKPRRQFIDWGVFHVEHLFFELWNNAQRLLKQRNAAIKSKLSINEVVLWDRDLICVAEALDFMRQAYLEQFIPLFHETLALITDLPVLTLKYYPGWNREQGLVEQLSQRVSADYALGYTYVGPHRADLRLTIDGVAIQEILSRGQQKLVVFALRFAQAQLLAQQTGKRAIFLIDDLPSELDSQHQQNLFALIAKLSQSNQFFLTGVHKNDFERLPENKTMFHVEHGVLAEVAAELQTFVSEE